MKKLTILVLFLVGVMGCTFSGEAQVTFQKVINGGWNLNYGNAIVTTSDGGYIIGSYSNSISSPDTTFLIKMNYRGDTLWTKKISSVVGINSIQETSDGGYILAAVGHGLYLIKMNSIGDTLWTKNYIGETGYSIRQTNDTGYIIAGITGSSGTLDICLMKTDSIGNVQWTKTYGGTGYDYGNNILQTADGGFIVAGYTESFGFTGGAYYIIRTAANGDTLWTRCFESGSSVVEFSIVSSMDGGYVISGQSVGIGALLFKIDSIGNLLWSKGYNVYAYNPWYPVLVSATNDGGYILTGARYRDPAGDNIFLFKTDANGDTVWTRKLGFLSGDNQANAVQQTTDGGYIVVGFTDSLGPAMYIVKTDSLGNRGCNDDFSPVATSDETAIVTQPATTVTDINVTSSSYSITIGSGVIVNSVCFFDGISEINNPQSAITIYPNPTNGSGFTIHAAQFAIKSVEVFDVVGERVCYLTPGPSPKGEGSVVCKIPAHLPQGIYFVRVSGDDGRTAVQKLVVE